MDDIADNNKDSIYQIAESKARPVSVDLRVSRIYRHLAASPSFGGQLAKEMPLYGDNMKDS